MHYPTLFTMEQDYIADSRSLFTGVGSSVYAVAGGYQRLHAAGGHRQAHQPPPRQALPPEPVYLFR